MAGTPAALEDASWRGRVLGTGGFRGTTGAALTLNTNEDDSEGGTR